MWKKTDLVRSYVFTAGIFRVKNLRSNLYDYYFNILEITSESIGLSWHCLQGKIEPYLAPFLSFTYLILRVDELTLSYHWHLQHPHLLSQTLPQLFLPLGINGTSTRFSLAFWEKNTQHTAVIQTTILQRVAKPQSNCVHLLFRKWFASIFLLRLVQN